MSITHPTGRFGALVAESYRVTRTDPAQARERYWRALKGECTDAEIAKLKAGDLTDVHVATTLVAAYEAQDPAESSNGFYERSPSTQVSDAALRTRIREAEEKLEREPKDSKSRSIRLDALVELAHRIKSETIRREAFQHRAATRERQRLIAVPGCPGLGTAPECALRSRGACARTGRRNVASHRDRRNTRTAADRKPRRQRRDPGP